MCSCSKPPWAHCLNKYHWKESVRSKCFIFSCFLFQSNFRYLGAYTLDVIANTGFGLRVNSQKDKNNPFVKQARKAFDFGTVNPLFILSGKILDGLSLQFYGAKRPHSKKGCHFYTFPWHCYFACGIFQQCFRFWDPSQSIWMLTCFPMMFSRFSRKS